LLSHCSFPTVCGTSPGDPGRILCGTWRWC
jgi:hypothetical protein